ncbi:MAG: hypothetical protein QXY49_00805 [Thermofilaceae archaeon]
MSIPQIPEDVKRFLEEARKRGYSVRKIAVAKVPFEKYYFFENGEYIGEVGEEIALETDIIMCHDDLCVLFVEDEPVLVMERTGQKGIKEFKEL